MSFAGSIILFCPGRRRFSGVGAARTCRAWQADRDRLRSSGAVIPDATVLSSAWTTPRGDDHAARENAGERSSDLEGPVLGQYSISAEFAGFDLGLLRDVRVSRGDNKHRRSSAQEHDGVGHGGR